MLLDMLAAFDTINHTFLISRFREIGISGSAIEWFKSYIKYRFCNVKTRIVYPIAPFLDQFYLIYILPTPIFKLFKNQPKIRFHSFADNLPIFIYVISPNYSDEHTNL